MPPAVTGSIPRQSHSAAPSVSARKTEPGSRTRTPRLLANTEGPRPVLCRLGWTVQPLLRFVDDFYRPDLGVIRLW
jgi:hypothetical protein